MSKITTQAYQTDEEFSDKLAMLSVLFYINFCQMLVSICSKS